ncbi:MAG: type I-U CRISPR-associated helicase/endonuclease Cas3 [Sandaracinaceae bacterium]|nr:type I-U CRISPR-associated helicase/endonuclease Cas3 [Sandaracinaceae bacterium]
MSFAFEQAFETLTGHAPFPWQRALYRCLLAGEVPPVCDIPTGLGKTSVIAVWLLARQAGAAIGRRLVYVVNRRTVVDQTTEEVERLCARLTLAGIDEPLAVSTLRGQRADNRAWSEDPSGPAVICGTVDMIGSRLLFSGYRIGFRTRPLHAGFLGQDTLIVHDEAHLEPAFQVLLEAIQDEQARQSDPWPLRVMAMTATARSRGESFGLSEEDLQDPRVARRVHATKQLSLHEEDVKKIVDAVTAQTVRYADTGRAILVFLRTVDDVTRAAARFRKAGMQVQQLTGTMRGHERDRLASEDPVFRRFLPNGNSPLTGTVVLVCTSAGEVGVNLSSDHLVCDLSTFESMAQRFGRVNRFGLSEDSEIHVFHPSAAALAEDKARDAERRHATLLLLGALDGDASPHALGKLDLAARLRAFAPEPEICHASDILFDAWALTTVRGRLPGRPQVGPYLHGVAEWEPPRTHVAWRDEVDRVSGTLLEINRAQDLLEDYPLKPHELLTERTSRVLDTLIAWSSNAEAVAMPVWRVDEEGGVEPTTLGALVKEDPKRTEPRLAGCTLLLPPRFCHPVDGLLTVDGWGPGRGADVADSWLGEDGLPRRARVLDEETPPAGMRLIRTVPLRDDDPQDDERDGDEEALARALRWSWYERPRGADDEGSRTAAKPVLLDVHSGDVEREARAIVDRLPLDPGTKRAVILAARHHDQGKTRRLWQRSIGNSRGQPIYAKAGAGMRPRDITQYRHELGSLLDAERNGALMELGPEDRELALHLIATHHGRARPHFPDEELFDPEVKGVDFAALGVDIVARFATLQRRFGRWGLAYLESLVRAADYAASARPSEVVEGEP